MPTYSIAIDATRCTGCYACFLACKDEFVGNDYPNISAAQPNDGPVWVRIEETTHGSGTKIKVDYTPVMCQQCQDAPCMQAGDSGAVYRRADGIVIVDPEKAKGRKELVASCPYGAIVWNEALNLPQKCTLCAHMIDAGEKTVRCVETCPTQSLVFGDLDDPQSAISQRLREKDGQYESYMPSYNTQPTVKYFGLTKPFIAGEVLLADKPGECAPGAMVTLTAKDGKTKRITSADFLGDFEFKGLEADAEYTVRAEHQGYAAREIAVRTAGSVNVGEIVLTAK